MIDNLKQLGHAERSGERVGLVLSGGAARGAYELGVLSVLAPVLERRGERPTIIVGTSVGGFNAAYLAAGAHDGLASVVEAGCQLWREIEYGDVGVAATSYDTGRSVVFYDGPVDPPRDDVRSIDYASTRLAAAHVRAGSAIQALFPAVEVTEPAGMGGWYSDGGTSLNTPLKPALRFGAERLIVIGLNSTAGSPRAAAKRPADAFDGAAQALQALLADQLANDVATLATINQIMAPASPERRAPGPLTSTVWSLTFSSRRGSGSWSAGLRARSTAGGTPA